MLQTECMYPTSTIVCYATKQVQGSMLHSLMLYSVLDACVDINFAFIHVAQYLVALGCPVTARKSTISSVR